ncbi:bifunctional Bromodomain/Bromodomain-like superfamily [Babesia duncani]|uniref:Bifunctional Bromodomain/Bromodomain-like superfamily n=1 Tax=Babesia duncani TaxID=323732 RepID=A0AAD9PLJ7_9APIC|nr:bifunctional Bromodomain/Bromodomain-like superfamily [Babesia duncani]
MAGRRGPVGSSSTDAYTPWVEQEKYHALQLRLKHIYLEYLNKLIRKDKQKIFRFPVDTSIVTDYTNYVTNPMDFDTMLKKVERNEYNENQAAFDEDVNLIIKHCQTYNGHNTIFYQAADRLKEYYAKLRPMLLKHVSEVLSRKRRGAPATKEAPPAEPQRGRKKGNQSDSQASLKSTSSTKSVTSQRTSESVDSSVASQENSKPKKKRRQGEQPRNLHLTVDAIRQMGRNNPLIQATHYAVNAHGLTRDSIGHLTSSGTGVTRLANALVMLQTQLMRTPYAYYSWFRRCLNPLVRINSEIAFRRSVDVIYGQRKCTINKIKRLVSGIKNESYGTSVRKFVGEENIALLNTIYPKFSETLRELEISPHLLGINNEMLF